MEEKEIASPCVRNCCLDQQDMCVGCFRVLDEIVGWGAASKSEKNRSSCAVQQEGVLPMWAKLAKVSLINSLYCVNLSGLSI